MAERVRITGNGLNEGIDAQVTTDGNVCITFGAIDGTNVAYEGIVSGAAPIATHDFYSDAGRLATRGYVLCDGAGNVQVDISKNGIDYGSKFTMKSGEKVDLDGYEINKIRVTRVADSAYRINII